MTLRFRKSIKLAPGVRMNLSGGGLSWTLGPRGASIGIGKRGTYLNSGIPGTGLYSRQPLSGASDRSQPSRQAGPTVSISMTVSVEDDGTITFKDSNGNPASEALIEAAKKQQGDVIKVTIQKACDDINGQVEALGGLHLDAPHPSSIPTYRPQAFNEPRPQQPTPKTPGFIAKFFKNKVAKIEDENARAQSDYEDALREWEAAKAHHDTKETQKQRLIASATSGNPEDMETFLSEILMDIVWPRETVVSFEVRDGGSKLAFDVDLPEVENMPSKTASVPQRGFKLSVKEMGPTQIQKLYARHIHSIGFRLLGEAFGMLPTIQEVTLSGYSQRKSKTTGQVKDDYLLSVVATRSDWEGIDFNSLDAIDVVDSFTRFDLRRDMTKTGLFKPVQPFLD